MSATWARREGQAGAVLGVERVHRRRGESAPDLEPVKLASGIEIQPEIKSRKRGAGRLVLDALEQARSYAPRAIPLAIIFEKGARDAIACLPLSALARLLGLDEDALRRRRERPIRRKAGQLELLQIDTRGEST